MAFTAYGIFAIAITLLSIILRLLPLGDLSLWAMRIEIPLIMLVMVTLGFLTYSKLKERGNMKEAKMWPLLSIGGFLPFFGFIIHIFADLMPERFFQFAFIGNIILTLAYVVLIIALWRLSTVFVSDSKLKIWIPTTISALVLCVSMYILIFQGMIDAFFKIGFTLFILMDILTIFLCYIIYQRTRGGALSVPFTFIAAGIGIMTIYELLAILFEALKIMTFHHPIQIVLAIALCIQVLGFDLRYSIELQLAKH